MIFIINDLLMIWVGNEDCSITMYADDTKRTFSKMMLRARLIMVLHNWLNGFATTALV